MSRTLDDSKMLYPGGFGELAVYRALITAFISLARVHAQSFDVASVRPHDPADKTFAVHMPTAGQFSGEGVPVNLLVMIAYDVQESQIAGGPNWLAGEKWDITAKCDDAQYSFDETKRMLQHLLEERFSSGKNATNISSGEHSISMERGSMARMAAVLATAVGRPVVDRTGLADLYDLSVVRLRG